MCCCQRWKKQFFAGQHEVEVDLVGSGNERLIEGGELGLQVLGVGVQPLSQLLNVGGGQLFHLLGSLGQLDLDLLRRGRHALLEFLQVLVHLQLQVIGERPNLRLQILHALLQVGLQLLALLHQDGLQGLDVHGLGVGGQLLFQLLHLLLDLDLHVFGVGLQLLPDGAQLLVHALSQHVGLGGDLGDQVLGCRGQLLLQGDCILADHIGALDGNANVNNGLNGVALGIPDILSKLRLPDHGDGVVSCLGGVGNIVPEGIGQHIQLWLGLCQRLHPSRHVIAGLRSTRSRKRVIVTTWKGLLDFGLLTTLTMRLQYIYMELVAVMKVFVVLAVAVLSGCHANLFTADAPKPQLEVLTDAFWDYIAKATETADDTLQMIRKSQFGQEINLRLADSTDIASKYAVTLQEQLHPAAQDLMTKITAEADELRNVLTQELSTVREKLEPYTEEMKIQIQQRVEQLKQELAPYAESMDSEALRTILMQKSEELKTNLEQSMKDLQAQLVPYTDDLKLKVDQHMKDFKESVAPMAEKVQVELTQRANVVKQMVAPYAEDMRENLDPYAHDLQAQLMTLYDSFVERI
ncbi:Apolipoprotein A-IV [Liparis tanakae]|uniref:Apolipoprotein A-IV n=1 Tax=Liparis tanakae TaxID=230148 RepID=A0A4Z2JG21_9TELE|nr:Apolipoprotein A-IV [Liparis tanakae]